MVQPNHTPVMEEEMAKILAVDDDPEMGAYYLALFSEAGLEIDIASDGFSALRKCLDCNPDLLILDVDIPNSDGISLFTTVRRILQMRKPVLFVTGLPEKVRRVAATYSRVAILEKPAQSDILLRQVRQMLFDSGAEHL